VSETHPTLSSVAGNRSPSATLSEAGRTQSCRSAQGPPPSKPTGHGGTTGNGRRFDVSWFDRPVGCGWGASVGHAHYDLPLNGTWSDVTASFDIIETEEGLALALDDVHVL
jgi:hypothetical protein